MTPHAKTGTASALSVLAAAVAVAVGAVVLLGWAFDIPLVTTVLPGRASMKPNTAVALMLAGVSLWTWHSARRWSLACAAGCTIIGTLTLAEYLFAADLGIDRLLFPHAPAGPNTPFAGRMGIRTALSCMFTGTALMLLEAPSDRLRRWAEACGVLVGVAALLSLVGHIYGVAPLTPMTVHTTQMAVHTAAVLALLSVGIVASIPGARTAEVLTSQLPGGTIARRLVPTVIVALVLTGLVWQAGEHAGWYGTQYGLTLMVTTAIIVLLAAILFSAAQLNRLATAGAHAESEAYALTERLRLVARGTNIGLWDWDLATNKVTFSAEWKRQIGYDEAELSDDFEEWRSRVHPDDLDRTMRRIQEFLSKPYPGYETEFRLRHKDGSYRWIVARATVLLDAHGQPTRMLGTHHDDTSRREAEQALRQSEQRWRLFVEHAPAALAMLDRDLRYLAVSRRWMTDYKLGDHAPLGRLHYDLFPEIPDRWKAIHQRGLAGEVVRSDEDRFDRADGTVQWLHWEVRPWRVGDGSIGGIVIFTEDITERKQVESEALRNEQRFQTLAESAPVGIFRMDAHGNLTYVNEFWCRLSGCSRTEMSDRGWRTAVHPDDQDRVLATWTDAARRGAPFHLENRYVRADGSVVWVSERAAPERDAAGQVIGWVGTAADITERKRVEHDLRRLASGLERAREAERTRIAREIHDELGQALTGLKMDLAWLRRRLGAHDEGAAQRAQAMLELLNGTVQTVRRIAGELRPGVLDDLGVAAAVRGQAAEFVRRTRIATPADTPDELAVDDERATAAFRILQEALTNVARHAGATQVAIGLRRQDDVLLLDVRDNGRGIAPGETGAGSFGLLGMRERAEAWGGSVLVARGPGGGTVVTLRLPLGVTLDAAAPP